LQPAFSADVGSARVSRMIGLFYPKCRLAIFSPEHQPAGSGQNAWVGNSAIVGQIKARIVGIVSFFTGCFSFHEYYKK